MDGVIGVREREKSGREKSIQGPDGVYNTEYRTCAASLASAFSSSFTHCDVYIPFQFPFFLMTIKYRRQYRVDHFVVRHFQLTLNSILLEIVINPLRAS